MSQPSPTGYAMANEDMEWDGFEEFINPDAEFHWPAAGHDMQGVGTGEDGEPRRVAQDHAAPIEHALLVSPGSHVFSHALAGNDKRNKEWLSDVMHGLPRCPSQQQLDPQDFHHAVSLPLSLHGGTPDRAIAALGAVNGFHSLGHMDHASENNTQNIGYLYKPDATQTGVIMPSPPMLLDLDGIDSEHSSSTRNASTGPPSTAIHTRPCACIACVEIGCFPHPMTYAYHRDRKLSSYPCRYPGCQERKHFIEIAEHERSHFHVEGQYPCTEEHCTFTTKRWSDLKRHSSSKHCTSLKKPFPCPVLWCKWSGDNGFARKDKLNSHVKTVHAGMSMPGKPNQLIKPKVGDRA